MIHMGSDHRCVMATFTITTPKKDGRSKVKNDKIETKKSDRRDKTEKDTGDEKPELEKRYQEIIEKSKEKAEAAEKESSQSKGKTAENKKAAAAQAKSEKAERKQKKQTESSQKSRRRTMWRRQKKQMKECPGHRTANEEAGSIVLHVGLVEHDMNERVTFVISNEEICPEGEATIEHKRERDE